MTDVDDFFGVSPRFMFDLNDKGAEYYRDEMDDNSRALELGAAEQDGANDRWPELQYALAALARMRWPLKGRPVSGSTSHVPVVGHKGSLLNTSAEEAGRVIYAAVFHRGDESALVSDSGVSLPVTRGYVLDFRRNQTPDIPEGITEKLTCMQRVYNPVSKEWEWEFNYTMLVDESDYYTKDKIRGRLASDLNIGFPESYEPTFRIALRIVAEGS